VVGGEATGPGGRSVTPFIEIPTSRNEFNATQGGDSGGETTGNATSASINGEGVGGSSIQCVLNNTVLTNTTRSAAADKEPTHFFPYKVLRFEAPIIYVCSASSKRNFSSSFSLYPCMIGF
jgi:hypothetical protein